MKQDLVVSQSINVNAEISKVWESLTEPEIIKEYLFGTDTVTDWKPGSDIIFQGEYEGHKYRDKGIILENIPNKKISYSYWSGFSGLEDKPENYSTVTYNLEKIDDKSTKLNWTQKGYADESRHKHSSEGMGEFLKAIKAVIEK